MDTGRSRPRRYVAFLLAIAIISPLATAAFNLAVDPNDYWGMLGVRKIDPARPNVRSSEGPFAAEFIGLAANVRWYKPDAAVFGSSAVGGMTLHHPVHDDPSHPFGKRIFHYSAAGVSIDQMKHYFLHTEALSPLKSAIVELQFYMFNGLNQRSGQGLFDVLPMAHQPRYERRFVLGMLEAAFTESETTDSIDWLSRKWGFVPPQQWWQNLWATAAAPARPATAPPAPPPLMTPRQFEDRVLSIDRAIFIGLFRSSSKFRFEMDGGGTTFDSLREILAEARRRHTRLHLFLSPNHARMLEMVRLDGLWPMFEEWKRGVAAVVAEDAAAHPDDPVVLWDFTGYNSITTDPLPAEPAPQLDYKWYGDSVHFNAKTGFLILDRMFGTRSPERPLPADFGVPLTPANVETTIRAAREGHEQYERGHAAEIDELARMMQSVKGE